MTYVGDHQECTLPITLEGLWERNGIELVRTPAINDSNSPPPLSHAKAVAILDARQRPLDYRLAYYGLYAGMAAQDLCRNPSNDAGFADEVLKDLIGHRGDFSYCVECFPARENLLLPARLKQVMERLQSR